MSQDDVSLLLTKARMQACGTESALGLVLEQEIEHEEPPKHR